MSFVSCVKKAAPALLAVLAAGGTVATGIFSAQGAREADKRRERAEQEAGRKLTAKERFKVEAPAYAKAAAAGLGTIGCIFGAGVLSRHQQASIMSAYALLNKSASKYKDRVRGIFGEAGERTVERAVKQETPPDAPPWDEKQAFFFKPYGEFFERTMEDVYLAEYHLNRNLALRGSVTVNEFLDFLELEHVENGDILGWNLYDGEVFYGYQWIDFAHPYFRTDDGMWVCYIDTPFEPHARESEFSA